MTASTMLPHDGFHDAEDGSVGADTHRQAQHGDGGEARRVAAERAQTVAQILEKHFEHG
jgi:hypothetical protein